ncbi:uncharacterized protein [Nicotiana tomentosiformis]|uniref:uncharacterized protein n=1 Tax=Nicotiana tomentosiformis TaxID=4098 RepID=UPI00388C7085
MVSSDGIKVDPKKIEDDRVIAYASGQLKPHEKNYPRVKYEHQRQGDLLQRLDRLQWKWERITMEFVVGLPRTLRRFDIVWVIVDRLIKSMHFIMIMTSNISEQLDKIYIREIVSLHGVPVSIISDRGTQFTSHFWRAVRHELDTQLNIQMALYEALYKRQCRSPDGWFEPGEARLLGTDLVRDALEKVYMLQKYYEDPSHVLDFNTVQSGENLAYEEEQVAILDRQVLKLGSKDIASVKVQWRDQPVQGATWEIEHDMRRRYPHLFDIPSMILNPFEDKILFKMEKI